MIENAVGVFGLPLGIAANFLVNGKDVLVPMVTEEPSVVAAASNAARLVRAGGGFTADADPSLMIGQIQLIDVPDPHGRRRATARRGRAAPRHCPAVAAAHGRSAAAAHARSKRRSSPTVPSPCTSSPTSATPWVRTPSTRWWKGSPAKSPRSPAARVNLRILSNLSDRRLARARAVIPFEVLAADGMSGETVARRIESASNFAAASPHRAATHNKGVMNGIDAVAIATGNDWRAIEAGAHAYAARDGRYGPLAVWKVEGEGLCGRLELPLAVGTVGDRIRINPRARLALRVLAVRGARELAAVMAAVGLGQNFAALRALATEGIQRGHMDASRPRGSRRVCERR